MPRHAKVLNEQQLIQFEAWVRDHSRNHVRDMVLVQLSFRVALRVGEMSLLRWTDVEDSEGVINTDFVYVPSTIAKFGKRDRTIPMHPRVREALVRLRAMYPDAIYVCNKIYTDGRQDTPIRANTLTVYLWRLYKAAGFEGGSSHSGRRTFITKLARRANVHHCSLVDVQRLAGHQDVRTTELYIEPTDDVTNLVLKEA